MHYCEHCQRSFKTVQGLLGHQRMAHNSSSGEPMQSVAVMKTMSGCVEERLDRIEGLLGQVLTAAKGADASGRFLVAAVTGMITILAKKWGIPTPWTETR